MSVAGETTPEFNIIQSFAGLKDLQQSWNELFEAHGRGPQLFQSFNFIWHWANQTPSPEKKLRIVTAHLDGELVIVAPLYMERKFGLKVLSWAGGPVAQYGDILMKDHVDNLMWLKDAFKYVCETLRPDLFYLRKTRFDAAVTPLLENNAATILEENAAPYIEIRGAESFTEFSKRYSQRSRKSKRRHRRKLEEHGELGFALLVESSEANAAANHAIALKRQWLNDMKIISPAFKTDILDRFFDATSKPGDHPIGLLVSQLSVAEKPVALEIGMRAKNYYGAHLGAYDPAYIAHSPGTLQMQDTIAGLINEGIEIIDLFAPGDQYKYEWTDQSVPVYDFAYSVTMLGRAFEEVYLLRLRPTLKITAKSLSARLRQLSDRRG